MRRMKWDGPERWRRREHAQVSSAQEVVTTSAASGKRRGWRRGHVIPREGSNTFTGQFLTSGSSDKLQGNITQALKTRASRRRRSLSVYDVNPMGGGRLVRDKTLVLRGFVRSGEEHGAGIGSTGRGHPNAWTVDFDKSKQAFTDSIEARRPRVYMAGDAAKQFNSIGPSSQRRDYNGGGTGRRRVEATSRLYIPSRQPHRWSSPVSASSAGAGWGMSRRRYRFGIATTQHTLDDRGTDSRHRNGDIPNLATGCHGLAGGFRVIDWDAGRREGSRVFTGAQHEVRVQAGSAPVQTYDYFTTVKDIRVSGGQPNQLTSHRDREKLSLSASCRISTRRSWTPAG